MQHDERPFLGRQRSHFALVLVFLIATLTWDFESKSGFNLGTPTDVHIRIKPGLYYDHQQNPLIKSAVEQFWPTKLRTYQPTPWILTGDARTGLPFFFNHKVEFLDWKRVFLTVPDDGEVLALDIAFPETGYDATKPIFLILIGANGGSNEEYCRDLAARRTAAGSTVVVLVSRGLMDMPLVTGNIFRADRLSDVHAAATTIRRAMMNGTNQMLAGVGYSMGAIVLNNYVATYGSDCALSAGFSVSGALDCRLEMDFVRPKRVWQPMIADFSRKRFVAKWGERIKARLSQDELIRFLRVTNVVDLDKFLAVAYYKPKYRDLLHYYSDMGALGDIPIDILQNGDDPNTTASESYESTMSSFHIEKARIWNLSIPLCVLHAFDDPIATWRGIAANQGFLHPESLVQSGQGNLLLLLTEKGGHIGWPTGLFPFSRGWEFVSETAASFADAISQASQYLEQVDGSNSKKNNTTSKSGSLLSSNTCPVLPIQPQKVIRKDIIQL